MDPSDLDTGSLPVDATDELYRLIADTIPQIVWSARADGSGEFHNARASEYYGVDASQLAGMGWHAMVHPEDLPGCLDSWNKAVANGSPFSFEYRLRRKDGVWRWHLSRGLPLRDRYGKIVRWFGTATDIEDQKRAAEKLEAQIRSRTEALCESEQRYRQLIDVAPDAIFVHSDGRIVLANPAMVRLFGAKSGGELIGREVLDLVAPGSRELVRERIRQLYETPQSVPLAEVEYVRLDGAQFSAEATAVSFSYAGRPAAQVVARDITGRKAAERALRESEQRFRALTELSSDWYWEQDAELRFVGTAGRTRLRAGISEADHIGKRRWELPGTEILGQSWEAHKAALAARASFHELILKRTAAEGAVHYINVSGEPRFDGTGTFAGYHGVAKDVTERYRAEDALRKSETRFRSLTSLSSDFYWETDAGHRLRLLEYGAKHKPLHPREHLLGKTRWEIASIAPDEEGWRRHRAALDAHLPFRDFEFSRPRQDGVVFHYSISGEPMHDAAGVFLGYRGVGRDVTERLRAERALRESERRIRALLRRLTATQEAERRRIAAGLHDFVGQNLTALGMALETLRTATSDARAKPNAPTFEEMAGLLRDTMDSVRQTMSDLRPPLLDDYGLLAALESHARQFSSRTGLAVTVEGQRIAARPAPNVELALFRIAQEALVNALKHAGATNARVVLSSKGGFLRLSIEDNGSGFAQPSGARAEHRGGWGLPMMRERAEEAGGTLRIEFPARGARVVAEVPHVDTNHPG